MKKIWETIGVIAIITLGTMVFFFLLFSHPYIGGTADVITFIRNAIDTMKTQTITAQGAVGNYNALQLFPFVLLEGTAMTLQNSMSILLNFWLLQQVVSFLHTVLFYIVGKRITKKVLGGIMAALMSFVMVDSQIIFSSGMARFLSSYQYSFLFLIAIFFYLTTLSETKSPWKIRIMVFILGSGMLLSHHHFGIIRSVLLLVSISLLLFFPILKNLFRAYRPQLLYSAQGISLALLVGIIFNIPYISFFLHDFILSGYIWKFRN